MNDECHPPSEYRWARQVSAVLLIAVIVHIVVLDVIVEGYDLNHTRFSNRVDFVRHLSES